MGDADYLHAFSHVIMPIAMEFAPDLVFSLVIFILVLSFESNFVLVSAGFDAAEGDQLGACLVSPSGYAHMTHMLCGLANGRVVVALEVG
jgi:histone deacetylase 6